MKKTKKALLAAIACTVAVAGSGLILAACESGEPTSHTHDWGNWTVEDQNKPTAQSGGKATRDCGGEGVCDAEISEKEYALPALDDNSYTVSNDTAQVGVAGTGKYTYNKDGVTVEFTAATPAKPHVHEGGVWTVSEENKPTADKKGKATRTCTAADAFCGWTAEDLEYELPELNETDYSVKVTKQSTCFSTGTVEYTFNKDGVKVTFNVETPVDPAAHNLKKHDGSEADCATQTDGCEEYYYCECGKYFKDADGQEEIEDLADMVIPATHDLVAVAANANSLGVTMPNGTNLLFKNMAHYVCNVCGKTFKDEDGTNEVTSVYNYSRRGMLVGFGQNSVDATGVSNATSGGLYAVTYVAETAAVHKITFDESVNIGMIGYVLTGTTANVNTYTPNDGWITSSAAYGKFIVSDAAETLTNSVAVNMEKGEWITIFVSVPKFNVNIKTEPVLTFGDNKVNITEAYSMFIDEYEYVPTETKQYSMTVPVGVEVLMDDNDFILGDDRTVNFEGTAGKKIVFAFKNSAEGPVTVTIGEAVELPKLTPDEPLSSFELVGHAVSVLEIGDIEEGTYTVTIKVPNSLMRTFVYFGKNISQNYEDYFANNGNTVSGNPAEVSFMFPMAQVLNGAPYQATMQSVTWKVTLDLKQGDKLVFVHSGTTGSVQISLDKA